MLDFYIYNTLTKEKEKFIPVEEGKAGIYTCGLTVYNYAHIGNLRTYVFEDILIKALKYIGYEVKHVMNVTDVGHLQSDSDSGEDKMQLGAEREHKSPWEIARFYEAAFFEDFNRINIQRPSIVCRATEHIADMIDLIQRLEANGYTYIANGNVYFSIDKFPDYNKLAALSIEALQAGSRIDIDPGKQNPLDFVLWFTNSKFSNQIMQWDSPWGTGFPGWHIECSAMSMKYLGEYIDIHCGGVDHIPVHHTNEIAQSEAAIGHKWVNYWMHGEFLVLDGQKMSKSTGDFLTIKRLIDESYDPLAYRFMCLQSRYRKQLLFSFEALKEAQSTFFKLRKKIAAATSTIDTTKKETLLNQAALDFYKKQFAQQLCDDLNLPNALTVLEDVLKDTLLNRYEKVFLIKDFDKVLSLDLLKTDAIPQNHLNEALIESLIEERNLCRKNKDWTGADRIRIKLLEMPIEIIDTKDGTSWRLR